MKAQNYFGKLPSSQNAVDLFEGQWFSTLPAKVGAETGGIGTLFDDDRIHWASSKLGGFQEKNVLNKRKLLGHCIIGGWGGPSAILGK